MCASQKPCGCIDLLLSLYVLSQPLTLSSPLILCKELLLFLNTPPTTDPKYAQPSLKIYAICFFCLNLHDFHNSPTQTSGIPMLYTLILMLWFWSWFCIMCFRTSDIQNAKGVIEKDDRNSTCRLPWGYRRYWTIYNISVEYWLYDSICLDSINASTKAFASNENILVRLKSSTFKTEQFTYLISAVSRLSVHPPTTNTCNKKRQLDHNSSTTQ